jgi:dihydrofolate reductase
MGRVIYSLNVSLDGYAADADGGLGWANVDDELHQWFNDRTREAGVFAYGTRMYELMAAYWPRADTDPEATPVMREFARIWTPMPKVVFSSTLDEVDWNSRLVRDSAPEEVGRLREQTDGDVAVGGPTLAASLIRAGLIDEYRLLVHPVILGAGLPFFPDLEQPIGLRNVDEHEFASGVVYMGYAAG